MPAVTRYQIGGQTLTPGQLLGRPSLLRLLESIAPEPEQAASSVYLRPSEGLQFLDASTPESRAWRERLAPLDRSILNSDTGLVALRAGPQALVILPPFPVPESSILSGWYLSPLLSVLEAEYTIGVVLLRLGRFSVAVYRGERLQSSKTDARYVKGRHHAGGTSQKRFQRIREGQVRRLYDKACEAVQSQFTPFAGELDYVLLGGDKFTLDGFQKVCPHLNLWRDKILSRRLNVRDPKRDTLELVGESLSESKVYPLEW